MPPGELNRRLTDLLNMKRGEVLRDSRTGETILDPAKLKGQNLMFVPPDGRVIVGKVESITLTRSPDGFARMSISANIVSHTTVAGVLVESSDLEFAPPPTKPKRLIEEA